MYYHLLFGSQCIILTKVFLVNARQAINTNYASIVI